MSSRGFPRRLPPLAEWLIESCARNLATLISSGCVGCWKTASRLSAPGLKSRRTTFASAEPRGQPVEALVFGLRDGIDALKDRSNQRRLGELNDEQMRDVAARVQKFLPRIAPAWKPADVEALLTLWSKLR